MNINKKILASVMISLMSFSLVSCYEPDTESKPPDITTGQVTQITKPVTSAAVTTVSSAPTVTKTTVTGTSVSDKGHTGFDQAEYEYDELGRLVKVKYDENNYIEYEYDANGNIKKISKTENGKKTTDSTK